MSKKNNMVNLYTSGVASECSEDMRPVSVWSRDLRVHICLGDTVSWDEDQDPYELEDYYCETTWGLYQRSPQKSETITRSGEVVEINEAMQTLTVELSVGHTRSVDVEDVTECYEGGVPWGE